MVKNGKIQRSIYISKELDQFLVQRSKLTLRTISSEIEALIRRGLASQQSSDLEAINILEKPKNIQVNLGAGEN